MKLKTRIAAALGAGALLGGCETSDLDLLSAALSLYSDVSYLNGDCPYGLRKWYDRDGHHRCSANEDHPSFNHHGDRRQRDGEDGSSSAE